MESAENFSAIKTKENTYIETEEDEYVETEEDEYVETAEDKRLREKKEYERRREDQELKKNLIIRANDGIKMLAQHERKANVIKKVVSRNKKFASDTKGRQLCDEASALISTMIENNHEIVAKYNRQLSLAQDYTTNCYECTKITVQISMSLQVVDRKFSQLEKILIELREILIELQQK